MRQEEKKKEMKKKEKPACSAKKCRAVSLSSGSVEIFFAGAHIDDTENRSRHACRCDDGAQNHSYDIQTLSHTAALPFFFRCTIWW